MASSLLGIGLELAFSAMSNLIVRAVPTHQTGVASGINANIRTIGGAVGAGVMSSIVTSKLLSTGLPDQSGCTHGFLFSGICTVLAVVATILIPETTPDHQNHAELAHRARKHPHRGLGALPHPALVFGFIQPLRRSSRPCGDVRLNRSRQ